VNGLVTGLAAIYLVMGKEVFKTTDGIFHYYPKALHYILSSYVGYSVYDMVVMCFTGDEEAVMWLHHIVGALGAYLMMVLISITLKVKLVVVNDHVVFIMLKDWPERSVFSHSIFDY
jgi:hypothetical protein